MTGESTRFRLDRRRETRHSDRDCGSGPEALPRVYQGRDYCVALVHAKPVLAGEENVSRGD